MIYKLNFHKRTTKHMQLLAAQKSLLAKAKELLEIIRENPFQVPPDCEKLSGDLDGKYSRRINIKHRLVYEVDEESKSVKVLSMWSHYEF